MDVCGLSRMQSCSGLYSVHDIVYNLCGTDVLSQMNT